MVTAIGVTIEEALSSIGMTTSNAVVHLDYNRGVDGLPAAMAWSFAMQQCSQWAYAGLEENLDIQLDWLCVLGV